jgi:hypothetical protein
MSPRRDFNVLHLNKLDIIYAGEETFLLEKNMRAVAATRMLDDIKPLS